MSKRENAFICPACGEPNDGDLEFCEWCGEDLRPEEDREKSPKPSGGSLSAIFCIMIGVGVLLWLLMKIG